MEYASYLAGEKWSDHPACTHPLLGELARQVNDFISDEARQALVELVPNIIGLTGADVRIDLRIALRAARTALPIVAEERQQIMATAVLTCERLRADLEGCPGAPLSQETFRRQTAPTIVRYAVQGIARACIPNPDSLLHDLLVGAIEDCKTVHTPEPRRRTARNGQVAATWSSSAAKAAATLSGQTTA